MTPYFTKTFDAYGLETVDYWRCNSCGFVGSKTHYDMTPGQWTQLNLSFHNANNARADNPYNRAQRYLNQAIMIHLLVKAGAMSLGKWLDWGSGTGNLSEVLDRYFDLRLNNFDAYIAPRIHPVARRELRSGDYDLVVNTGVFEHVTQRGTLDEIDSFVSPVGQLAIHTLVRGEVPGDPGWMYLLPVHCAFHTNKSMQILMEQWRYTCSVYNPDAKLWVMFKGPPAPVRERAQELNARLGHTYLHFKEGFVDYWP